MNKKRIYFYWLRNVHFDLKKILILKFVEKKRKKIKLRINDFEKKNYFCFFVILTIFIRSKKLFEYSK